jgi:L-asparaginase
MEKKMKQKYGKEDGIIVIVHGGSGPQDPNKEGIEKANKALKKIAKQAIKQLLDQVPASKVACYCLKELENDPQFNAGVGSALQSDGIPRLSASLMNGHNQSFSGVISATYLPHPSILIEKLQKRRAKVLTSPGTELLARELSLPVHSNLTEKRSKRWIKQMDKADYPSSYFDSDTVGCVIRDLKGRLIAAASTGGIGNEYPGRVGDTGTVSGNYASKYAAVTVTGKGEQITDDAVAARIETRVRDGMSLEEASNKTYEEALAKKRQYGWISVSQKGEWGVARTTNLLPYVVYNEKGLIDEFVPDQSKPEK